MMTFLNSKRLATAILLLTGAVGAFAQAYPTKPITVILPCAVGGTTDIVARLVTSQIGNALGQPLIVDNRAGGGGVIGWSAAARTAPDGYTFPDGRKRLAAQGLEPVPNSPAQASQFVAAEMQRWDAVVKAAGIKAE